MAISDQIEPNDILTRMDKFKVYVSVFWEELLLFFPLIYHSKHHKRYLFREFCTNGAGQWRFS